MRPLIGIVCHADFRQASGRPIYGNNRTYIHAVEDAGGVPILIPLFDDIGIVETLLPRLDGLLISGGLDIQPEYYHEQPHPLLGEVDPRQDELELMMAHWAIEEDVPTLGICRGMQLLNVALGGTLYQDLEDQYPGSMKHMYRDQERARDQVSHRVFIESGSRMEKIFRAPELWINSIHHQAIRTPGRGVRITGHAEDGVPELMEVFGHRFMVAVQGHPEELYRNSPTWARLFTALIKACDPSFVGREVEEPTAKVMAV